MFLYISVVWSRIFIELSGRDPQTGCHAGKTIAHHQFGRWKRALDRVHKLRKGRGSSRHKDHITRRQTKPRPVFHGRYSRRDNFQLSRLAVCLEV